ncbi:MAG: hypothetical protein N2Z79_03800, partial [Candidatus Omnitrophica bacterium]|nr:hypothetical protein [Candidatus Omnitrophota bacterium]
LLVSNDRAVLHLGSYLNVPIVAIFGPTDDIRYGPWSEKSFVVKKEIFCRPCKKAHCRFGTVECMRLIKPEDVLLAIKIILNKIDYVDLSPQYKRILISRTDKIGDVILSTPVIKAIREGYPHSYLAMMVSPSAREILEENPYLDKIIILDKKKTHRGLLGSIRLVLELKREHFDLALILHPHRRVHLLTFLTRIKRRIGFNYKWGFFLTDKLPHLKHEGQKHELEYNLDLVRYLGIEPKDKKLYLPIREDAERWVREFFSREKITPQDKLLAINPSSSCPSRRWPVERYAELADKLIEKYGFKVLIISGKDDINIADRLQSLMRYPVINLAGKTSLSQLTSLLKRCKLY